MNQLINNYQLYENKNINLIYKIMSKAK